MYPVTLFLAIQVDALIVQTWALEIQQLVLRQSPSVPDHILINSQFSVELI